MRNWSWRESAAGEKPWVLVGFYEEEAHRAYRTVPLPSSLEDEKMRTAERGRDPQKPLRPCRGRGREGHVEGSLGPRAAWGRRTY